MPSRIPDKCCSGKTTHLPGIKKPGIELKTLWEFQKWVDCRELLIDELRDYRFYASDWIHPSNEATNYIWNKLSEQIFSKDTFFLIKKIEKIRNDLSHQPKFGMNKAYINFISETLEKIKNIKNQTKYYDWSKEISQINAILNK